MILGKLIIGNLIVIENLIIPDDVLRFLVGRLIGIFPLILKLIIANKEQKCR